MQKWWSTSLTSTCLSGTSFCDNVVDWGYTEIIVLELQISVVQGKGTRESRGSNKHKTAFMLLGHYIGRGFEGRILGSVTRLGTVRKSSRHSGGWSLVGSKRWTALWWSCSDLCYFPFGASTAIWIGCCGVRRELTLIWSNPLLRKAGHYAVADYKV